MVVENLSQWCVGISVLVKKWIDYFVSNPKCLGGSEIPYADSKIWTRQNFRSRN